MTTSGVTFRAAVPSDLDLLLRLMHCLQQDDPWSVPFREEGVRESVRELLANPPAGRVFLIRHDQLCIGYLVVSLDFSIEYGTKHSFVRVMATKQFRRSSSISGLGLPFFTNLY